MEDPQQKVENASSFAVEKTREAQEVVEKARLAGLNLANEKAEQLIQKAGEMAEELKKASVHTDDNIVKALSVALRDVFGENENSGRFIDTARIPLICQDLKGIHGEVSDIKDNLKWITRLIIGAVVLALMGLVLVKIK